jgi:hypothetical protein
VQLLHRLGPYREVRERAAGIDRCDVDKSAAAIVRNPLPTLSDVGGEAVRIIETRAKSRVTYPMLCTACAENRKSKQF